MAKQTILRGRADERATLHRLLNAVRGGESRVLVLRGEPGVGKVFAKLQVSSRNQLRDPRSMAHAGR
jgi:predicted ATP-dependent serine protease